MRCYLFTQHANAPRSHQGSAICDPGLDAPDQSGVQPCGAIGLLYRCSRFCRSSVGTTLRLATEAARTNDDYAPDRFWNRAQRRRRPLCRTAHSDRRSAGLTPTQSRLDRRVTVLGACLSRRKRLHLYVCKCSAKAVSTPMCMPLKTQCAADSTRPRFRACACATACHARAHT